MSKTDIKTFQLDDPAVYRLHKEGRVESDFGLDNSSELIAGGFGLYSSAGLKSDIGPAKTQYFRISLIRAGSVKMDIGLETFQPAADCIVFGFPGQVFSLYGRSDDFEAHYMLFKEEFMPESMLLKEGHEPYPFLTWAGVQSFQLSLEDAAEIEFLMQKINREIKRKKADIIRVIQLSIQLILAHAARNYEEQQLARFESATAGNDLFRRFVKLVACHFLKLRKVSDYARMLHVSSDHLNRTIKSQSEKTASQLIEDMILTEAKAWLLHTELSNAEIAWRLEFSDPSHFNKFFKKRVACTPLEFRGRSATHHAKSF